MIAQNVLSWTKLTYRFPLCSTGLHPLQFPPGPLPCLHNNCHHEIPEQGKGTDDNMVQESTFCTIMIWSTFYPNPISSKMMSRKFHASISMAFLHKCPLNYTLPYGGSNFQSDFFAFLIADSDSLRKPA